VEMFFVLGMETHLARGEVIWSCSQEWNKTALLANLYSWADRDC